MEDKIKELRSRYSEVLLLVIDEAIKNFSATRKGNNIAERKIIREYEYWVKYPISKIIGAMSTYNAKKCYLEGKDERYLRGIIRNINQNEIKKLRLFNEEQLEELFKKLKDETIGQCKKCKDGYIFDLKNKLIVIKCSCMREFENKKLKVLKENNVWYNNLGEI
jgi:hypothetical protein